MNKPDYMDTMCVLYFVNIARSHLLQYFNISLSVRMGDDIS